MSIDKKPRKRAAMPGKPLNTGFTVIELMAVIAIVSILAVVALAAYSDYVVRSKVAEGVNFAAEAKTTISEYFYTNGFTMPANNQQAGLSPPDAYDQFEHIARLEITSTPKPGTIEIEFKIPGIGTDNLLHLIPATAQNLVTWTCLPPATNGMDLTKVPPNCRGS